MNYLLDVNVLLAWGWSDHVDHARAVHWIAERKRIRDARLFTSPIPEIGFVRVSMQRAFGRITVQQAAEVLRSLRQSLGGTHRFLPDDVDGTDWPEWCTSAPRTTDAHLLTLAERHKLHLATLDAGIPGAFILPAVSKRGKKH